MFNRVSLLGLLFLCLVFFYGCKKEAVTTTNTNTAKYGFVKTYADGSATITFSYDNQGRLDSIVDNDLSGIITTYTLTYNSGSVVLTGGGSTVIYSLNSQGLATSDNAGNVYTYDNNGYLISTVKGTGSRQYTIANGNVTSIVLTNIDGFSKDTTVNTFGTQTDYRNYGLSFLGKNGTFQTLIFPYLSYSIKSNLLVTQTVENRNNFYGWTYTFDSLGRVTSELEEQSGSNNGSNLYTYTN